MPDFEIAAPDGKRFVVTAPEGASQADVMEYAQKQHAEMSASPKGMSNIDMGQEVGFMPRMLASLKMTPEGKSGFLKSLGYDVVTDGAGQQFVNGPKSMYPVNKPGLNFRDAADIGGDVAQTIPTMMFGSNPLSVAGAGAAGNAVRQGVSAALPGDDNMTVGDRITSIGLDAALSGAGQAGINRALGGTWSGAYKTIPMPQGSVGPAPLDAGGLDALRPGNMIAKMMQKSSGTPIAQQADDISRETGIQFTPGQRVQSRGMLTMEGMLRRHPLSADRWTEFDQEQLGKATQYLSKTLDSINPGDVGPALAGGSVTRSFQDVMDTALKARSAQGRSDFGAVDAASGSAPIFGTMNTVTAIDDIITRFDTPGGGDATAALVDKLKSLRSEFLPPTPQTGSAAPSTGGLSGAPMALTGKQIQRLLEIYGKAAAGTGEIFKDIDKSQQRLIAREVMNGLHTDIDAAKAMGGASENTANALEAARANWRANSKSINDVESSVLGRVFGNGYDKAPERVAEAFKNFRPTEIKGAFELLDKADPVTAQQVKRYLVEDAMRAAGGADLTNGAPRRLDMGSDAFSPRKFLSSIEKSPVWSVLDGNEKFQMTTTFRAMERLAERAGTDGSPTTPLAQAWGLVKSVFGGFSPTNIAGGVAGVVAPGKASDALLTPQGRKALIKLSTTSPTSKNFSGAAAYLTSLLTTDEPQTRP